METSTIFSQKSENIAVMHLLKVAGALHWCASVLNKRFLPLSVTTFGTVAKWVWAIGGSFPHDPETVGIGSLDAYSCPYITVSDISNMPNASSLLLVCARIAIDVRVLWFYLKPGRFQARELTWQIPGTWVLWCLEHHKQFTSGNRVWLLVDRTCTLSRNRAGCLSSSPQCYLSNSLQ